MWRKGFIAVPCVKEEIVMGDGVPGEHGERTDNGIRDCRRAMPSLSLRPSFTPLSYNWVSFRGRA